MHPERLGPYRIERRIGAGGMGNVYLGVHETTGQQAAVKVLPANMAREEGFVQRFSREIAVLRQLSNRHIVQLYQDGQAEDSTLYYAMEYVDGVTLTTEIMTRRRIPWNEVIELSVQIAAALKAAHDAGVIHRDLKPSNLMLTSDRVLKLADFGVASLFASSRLTRTGGIVGTAEYMSPEQARGQRTTRRSDLYSLGAVMYVMLTGRPPFTGATVAEVLQKHQFAQFDKPSHYAPGLPRMLEELVCQLLEKEPAKRLPDALVVMKRLEQIRSRLEFTADQMESETVERPVPGATVAIDADEEGADPRPHGTATTVRNLLRAEVSADRSRSLIAVFFDNTAVLMSLLLGLVGFALWMNRRVDVTPERQFQTAREWMLKPAGTEWIRAKEEFLLPLLRDNTVPQQSEAIQQMIARVEDYEFTKSLRTTTERSKDAETEIRRMIRRAFAAWSAGETEQARKQLQAVLHIQNQMQTESFLKTFVQETVEAWKDTPATDGRILLLRELIRKSEQSLMKQTEREAVVQSLEAALLLYSDDSAMAAPLAEIQSMLNTLRGSSEK